MPEDRDRRRLITPPAGVRAQTAPESWEGTNTDTPALGVPLPVDVPPDQADALIKMSRRVKTTLQSTQATLDRVSDLRIELDTVRLTSARNEGKLDVLLETLESERQERRQYTAVGVTAYQQQAELEHTRALAAIVNERDKAAAAQVARIERTAYRRALALKILAGVAAVWGVIATIVLAKCGG